MQTIKMALTKGRLEKKIIEIFERMGVDATPLREKGRKLIFSLADGRYEVVLAKAADVLTYIQHGVCDVGIVGKDTILEYGGEYYEVMDLQTGKCRFAVAGRPGTDLYSGHDKKIIATKYPHVTHDYFASKGVDVEIIKIEGSVELAPLVRLSDAIVDIVETGSTLKENGLTVLEDICDISARMIVNIAAMKLKRQEINQLIEEVKQGLEDGT
ncbi:MAG: ATP phosphoribosyltransferase [Eubacteriales bacterium]|jgi:ATP phosphoribosyltransferase